MKKHGNCYKPINTSSLGSISLEVKHLQTTKIFQIFRNILSQECIKARYCTNFKDLQCVMDEFFQNPAVHITYPPLPISLFRDRYAKHHLLRKMQVGGCVTEGQNAEALKSFLEGEAACAETNKRLSSIPFSDVENNTLVRNVQKIIFNILGHEPEVCDILCTMNSGGATADLKRKDLVGRPYNKEFNSQSVSAALAENFGYFSLQFRYSEIHVINHNVLTTVPKNFKTARTIAKEPTINMVVQKAMGNIIRRALLRRGVDLNDQCLNQKLARIGSADRSLATIDLANASNSLSMQTVKLLLPPLWYSVLDVARSQKGLITFGGLNEIIDYQMFSSMGNGFTFELESLIFYAIARACCSRGDIVAVYGDDIIVPSNKFDLVVEKLAFFGFTTNIEKSFAKDHPFRESCGEHFYFGERVTPVMVRSDEMSYEQFYSFMNQISLHPSYEKLWSDLAQTADYIRGPRSELSSYLHVDNVDDFTVKTRYNSKTQRMEMKIPISVAITKPVRSCDQNAALYYSQLGGSKDGPIQSIVKTITREKWVPLPFEGQIVFKN